MTVRFPLVLVVDDDPIICRTLQLNLEADGYDVLTAVSGREALRYLEQVMPDLAIVDLLLPDMHGFELCARVKRYLDLPIIMLTAVGTEESVVEGLKLYAEDYVVKPFRYRELLARIERVLKRARPALPECQVLVVNGELRVDFARHTATVRGREVPLTPLESRLLACLARRPNRVVSNEVLMDELWPEGEGDAPRLWVLVSRLRRKIEPDPTAPRYILTERDQGYRLVVED